jgi:uncharacterized protein
VAHPLQPTPDGRRAVPACSDASARWGLRQDGCPLRAVRGGAAEWIQEGSVAKEDRGFASMDRAKQREIASKGGKAAHQKGTAHEWTSEEAREAGRKGGMASHRRRKEMVDQPGGNPPADEATAATERSGGDDQNEQIR